MDVFDRGNAKSPHALNNSNLCTENYYCRRLEG
jgi:hypothetical protein